MSSDRKNLLPDKIQYYFFRHLIYIVKMTRQGILYHFLQLIHRIALRYNVFIFCNKCLGYIPAIVRILFYLKSNTIHNHYLFCFCY